MGKKTDILAAYNSPAIEKQLSEIKDRKGKNAFLESIMSDPNATVLNEINGHKTILLPGNKGPKTITWKYTKKMAFELNNASIDVAFVPELEDSTCTDSLIKMGNKYLLADFKYCVTTKSNTLSKELEHGFKQAGALVLKLESMDLGVFRDTKIQKFGTFWTIANYMTKLTV